MAVKGPKHHSDMEALACHRVCSQRDKMIWGVWLATIIPSAYSPELNPVEGVFKEVRRLVEGRIYRSIEEKIKAVHAYLSELESNLGGFGHS